MYIICLPRSKWGSICNTVETKAARNWSTTLKNLMSKNDIQECNFLKRELEATIIDRKKNEESITILDDKLMPNYDR